MSIELKKETFRAATPGPHVLITGGVHGDEFEPVAALRRLIDLFRSSDRDIAGFSGTVTLVPVVNENAFLRGHRCAEDGLDLARSCPGRPDGSLTERVAHALSHLIRTADFYIDLHTGGTELSVYPLAGYVMHPRVDVLDVQRRMARAFNLPVIWGTSATLEGRSLSVARDADIPAIYCEYLGSATCSEDGIQAYVSGCLNVLGVLGLIQRDVVPDNVRHIVENARPGSGHMQVCNPAPCAGFFFTSLRPGDRIRRGEMLGQVFPLDNSAPQPVTACESGIVLVLRTFPRVHEGDSVGVVLELDSDY